MTTASKLKAKINAVQERTTRLAQFGALTDRTLAKVEDELIELDERLDSIDKDLVVKLEAAEQRALHSSNQLAFA